MIAKYAHRVFANNVHFHITHTNKDALHVNWDVTLVKMLPAVMNAIKVGL